MSVNLTIDGDQVTGQQLTATIDDLVIQGNRLEMTGRATTAKKVLKVASPIVGFIGKLFFIPYSIQLAGNRKVYAVFLAYGNITSFSLLTMWSAWNIIDEEFRPLTDNEKQLFDIEPMGCRHRTMLTAATALGFLIDLPLAYMAYRGVGGGHLGRLGFFTTLFSEVSLPTYAMYKSLGNASLPRKCQRHQEAVRELGRVRQSLTGTVYCNKSATLHMTDDEIREYHGKMEAAKAFETATARVAALFEHLIETQNGLTTTQESKWISWPKKCISNLTSFGLWGTQLFFTYHLGAKAGSLVSDSKAFQEGFAGPAMTAAFAYLTFEGIQFTSNRTFNALFNVLRCKHPEPNLPFKLHSHLSALLTIASVVTTALAHGPTVELSKQDFSNPSFSLYLQIMMPLSIVFFIGNALTDLSGDLIKYYDSLEQKPPTSLFSRIHNYLLPSQETKEIHTLLRDLHTQHDELLRLLNRTTNHNLATWLQNLPPAISSQITYNQTLISSFLNPTPDTELALLNNPHNPYDE